MASVFRDGKYGLGYLLHVEVLGPLGLWLLVSLQSYAEPLETFLKVENPHTSLDFQRVYGPNSPRVQVHK